MPAMSRFPTPNPAFLLRLSRSLNVDASTLSFRRCISTLNSSSQSRPAQKSWKTGRTSQIITTQVRDNGRRAFTTSDTRLYKTVQEQRSRYRSGPFSWRAGVVFFTVGAGLIWYFNYEKARMGRKRLAEATKGVGAAKVGGPFELIDQNGKAFSSDDLKGKYALIYFGFTHCPDICPDELDKMARMMDLVEKSKPKHMQSVFVTCDPLRDTPAVVKSYLAEFHPRMIGLTGTYDQIKAVCKAYRVYFSTPPTMKPGEDYLVDHSIYFYLFDPEGDFVEAIGKQHSPEEGARIINDHIGDFKGTIDKS